MVSKNIFIYFLIIILDKLIFRRKIKINIQKIKVFILTLTSTLFIQVIIFVENRAFD